jgi:hypothetical protein
MIGTVPVTLPTQIVQVEVVSAAACKNPNLAKAGQAIDSAYAELIDAQKAKESDLGGHAAKVKDLLEQARSEVKDAIQWEAHNCKEVSKEVSTGKENFDLKPKPIQ